MTQQNMTLDTMPVETMFVFVTAEGRIMARLTDGSVRDVTQWCELLPRDICAKTKGYAVEDTPFYARAA